MDESKENQNEEFVRFKDFAGKIVSVLLFQGIL